MIHPFDYFVQALGTDVWERDDFFYVGVLFALIKSKI